jgi:hypothetical protein
MDVAAQFQQYSNGLVQRDPLDTNHEPQRRGAYRRSRSTAAAHGAVPANMLCDHSRERGAAEDYKITVEGENACGIRIVIGV